MRAALRFFFGTGWWVPWHLLMLLAMLPLAPTLIWLNEMVPGAGPQGGEMVFAVIMLNVFAFLGFSLINGALWATTLTPSPLRRYLLAPVLIVAGWCGYLALLFVTLGLATDIGMTLLQRQIGWITTTALFAAMYLGNLWAIARFRAGKGIGR